MTSSSIEGLLLRSFCDVTGTYDDKCCGGILGGGGCGASDLDGGGGGGCS